MCSLHVVKKNVKEIHKSQTSVKDVAYLSQQILKYNYNSLCHNIKKQLLYQNHHIHICLIKILIF